MMKFELTNIECELLLAFEKTNGLTELSDFLGKDQSVISRNLKALSQKSDVLEKRNGKWFLTQKGLDLNRWSEESIFSQRLVLQKQRVVKIATPREFASRILLPRTRELLGDDEISVSIVSSDEGIEKLLLNGDADFGFDCGRPHDPLIGYKLVSDESFVIVASPTFIKATKVKDFNDLADKHCLRFTRSSNIIVDVDVKSSHYYGTFSDIATMRDAAILGYGWCLVPYYTVREEIENGKLKVIPGDNTKNARYGVWWVRERKSIKPWVNKAISWLKDQEHKLCH